MVMRKYVYENNQFSQDKKFYFCHQYENIYQNTH